MRLVTFVTGDGREAPGALLDDLETIVDLGESFADMLALIDAGEAGLREARDCVAAARRRHLLRDVTLRAPVPVPRQVRDCMVFEKHVLQARQQRARAAGSDARVELPPVWYEQPIYYKSNRFSVVGPGADIRWPRYSEFMDFELELGAIIGRQGVDIPPARAHDHVFGYLVFNDVSARDAQMREMAGGLGPAKGKDFDTGNVMGPWLVTADAVPDPYDLRMRAWVNDELIADGTSADMHHGFERIIAHVSQSETLYPGEFIGSGTVGNGCLLEHGRSLSPGDCITLEIEGLGRLVNRIVRD